MNTKILALGLLSLALGASGCRNTGRQATQLQSIGLPAPRAARITIDKLPVILKNVQAGLTQFDFTGICGNGTDCIYFMQENGKFYIDFEAISKEQLPYLDSLKLFAKEHGYPTVETTYNNTPVDYDHLQYAPVLSLKVNADIDSIVKVGKQIEHTIFRNNDRTVYEIVP
ncbi:hypothetical protein [Phocaeicola coprophilus]|uniref:hypothetical protein n=1 Tax=Phocaeicola coprophilus TaxID=387090 RepID=UPI003995283F